MEPVPASVKKADAEYDRYFSELVFDRRSRPTDRTKSPEEIAMESAAQLKKLEDERVARMNGTEVKSTEKEHKFKKPKVEKFDRAPTADDLEYDDFAADEEIQPLTYKDGLSLSDSSSLLLHVSSTFNFWARISYSLSRVCRSCASSKRRTSLSCFDR
jgi:Nop14-like family